MGLTDAIALANLSGGLLPNPAFITMGTSEYFLTTFQPAGSPYSCFLQRSGSVDGPAWGRSRITVGRPESLLQATKFCERPLTHRRRAHLALCTCLDPAHHSFKDFTIPGQPSPAVRTTVQQPLKESVTQVPNTVWTGGANETANRLLSLRAG